MIKEDKKTKRPFDLWESIFLVSGVFSFVVCVLLIANYFQINRADPVNTKVLNALIERLEQDESDQALRTEIREFDLLARKAYFTNQWQIRFGGYLLLAGVLVCILAALMIDAKKTKVKEIELPVKKTYVLTQRNARKWLSAGGLMLAVTAMVFAYITHKNMEDPVSGEASTGNDRNTFVDPESNRSDDLSPDTTQFAVADTAKADTVKKLVFNPLDYPTAAMKNNFPTFRGAGAIGLSHKNNAPVSWDGASGRNIKWKTAVPLPGMNSPIVWGNFVFLTGANEVKQEVYCFNKNTGKIIWKTNVPKSTQSPKVSDDTGHAAASAATDGENVYAVFSNGDIAAIDHAGKMIWSGNLGVPDKSYGHSSSLIVYFDKLIVQYDQKKGSNLMALDTKTGKTIWSTPRKVKSSWSSPSIVNTGSRVEILVLADPGLSSYDPATGKQLWSINCTSGEVGPSIAYANGIAFAVNEYAKLAAIKVGDQPTILWENNDYLSDVPSPVATKDFLFVATSYGEVACYNTKSGEEYWVHDFEAGIYSSPMIVGKLVYLMDRKGTMHIFKAEKKFTLVGEPMLGEKSDYTPAFADGQVFIRAGNNLYCIGK